MYVTRLAEGLLGAQSQADSKVANVMSDCTGLLVALSKTTDPQRQLKVVQELQDLSNQYNFLPLGKQAVGKIIDLIKRAREAQKKAQEEKDGQPVSSLPALVRPCIQLLKNVTKSYLKHRQQPPPPNATARDKQAVSSNLDGFVMESENVLLLMDLVGVRDPYVQLATVILLTNILSGKKDRAQQIILSKPIAVNQLVALLEGTGDMVRNEALLLLRRLIDGNPTIQKIVAFDNVFDKVLGIAKSEGYLMGGVIVVDILKLIATMVEKNSSNQTYFVESGCVGRLVPFLESAAAQSMNSGSGGSIERRMEILNATLQILDFLLTDNHRVSSGKSLCPALLRITSAPGLPSKVKAYALKIVGRLIDGRARNQTTMVSASVSIIPVITDLETHLRSGGGVEAKEERRPALVYVLQLALGHDPASLSGVPADVMSAAHYALRSLLRKNFGGQAAVCQALSHVAVTYEEGGRPGSASPHALNPVRLFARTLLEAFYMDPPTRDAAHRSVLKAVGASPSSSSSSSAAALMSLQQSSDFPLFCPSDVWTAHSLLLHAMRNNAMAKQALFAKPPPQQARTGRAHPPPPSPPSMFERVVEDLLDWEASPRPVFAAASTPASPAKVVGDEDDVAPSSTTPLSAAFPGQRGGGGRMSSPRKGGTEGGGGGENAGSSFLVPAEALSARLLVIIEGLQANPSAIVQLMGAGGGQGGGDEEMKGVGDEEEAIPSVIRLLIKMAGASSAPAKGSSAQNNEQVLIARGLACIVLVMCLRHAFEITSKMMTATNKDGGSGGGGGLNACAQRLHRILIQAVTTSSLPVKTLKARLSLIGKTQAFLAAKSRGAADRMPPPAPSGGGSSSKSLPFLGLDLFDFAFVSRYESILGSLDSLLLSLLTAALHSKARTATMTRTPPAPLTSDEGGGSSSSSSSSPPPPAALQAALAKAVAEANQAKAMQKTLAGQLKRALGAIKMMDAKLKNQQAAVSKKAQAPTSGGAAPNTNGGGEGPEAAANGVSSSFSSKEEREAAEKEKKHYEDRIMELERICAEKEAVNEDLRSRVNDAGAEGKEQLATLQNKIAELTEEHEDVLVLLATEDLDKAQLLDTLEKLRNENANLRLALNGTQQHQQQQQHWNDNNNKNVNDNRSGNGSTDSQGGGGGGGSGGSKGTASLQNGSSSGQSTGGSAMGVMITPQRHQGESGNTMRAPPPRVTPSSGNTHRKQGGMRHGSIIMADMEGGTPVRERRDDIDQLP